MHSKPSISINNSSDEINLKIILRDLWRGRYIIFLSIIISFLFCLYYLFELAENKYQARSIFGFDNSSSNKNIFSNMSPLGGIVGLPTENNDLLTQINSGNFLRSVVLDLNLINDKEFFNVKKSSIELFKEI